MVNAYTGNSIVDYLKSTGGDASYANRSQLYASSGLNLGGYSGSASQNTALLNYLRGGGGATSSTPSSPTPSTPTPSVSSTPRVDYVNTLTSQLQSESDKYRAEQQAAQQKLIDYYASLEDPTSRYKRISEEQGLPQQQELVNAITKNVMGTEDLIDAIEPSVNQRSTDFLMTDADRTALVAREQDPLVKNLTKLLRSKQYEEIGLAGKQQMVADLLNLSLQGDEMRAKPLQLGVDYSTEDRKEASNLLSGVLNTKASAYNADITSQESKAAADLAYSREKELKAMSGSDKAGKQQVEDTWNSILGRAKTEYDVWKYIDENQDALRKAGVDVDELWSRHAALAAKVGVGGEVRSSGSAEDFLQILQNL